MDPNTFPTKGNLILAKNSLKLSVQNDLTFGDITGKVRDRVSDIIVWHGQDRNLCYGSLYALYDSGALIQRSQLTVQVSRITFTGRNLSTGGGNLTHPIPDLTGYITEGQIVLDRQLHGQSIYPPISVLPSLSRLMKDGIGEGYTRADHQDVANQLFSCYAKVGDARSLASVIGEDELSPIDKQYLVFGNEFEHEFIGQGMDENRSMEDTLNKAWELLGLLPREELDRVNTKVLDQYYHPTTIDAVAKAKAEADAMNE